MHAEYQYTALVHWPSAPLTDSLVRNALPFQSQCRLVTSLPESPSDPKTATKIVQWSTYDSIDHDLTHESPITVLSSSYTIRKALIRKHFLSRCIHSYLVKHPQSPMKDAVPKTWDLEISFADELDDMWGDELWDLRAAMDEDEKSAGQRKRWWILKPGMADRGMGIRLFSSREALQQIFEGFEEDEDEEGEDRDTAEETKDETAVVTSQLRHFVIQVHFHCIYCLSEWP